MTTLCAGRVRVRGVVQGVGFRPFVYRLAREHALSGSVVNSADGVDILIEGSATDIETFVTELHSRPPAAAVVVDVRIERVEPSGVRGFGIGESVGGGKLSTGISPDLPVCDECLRELFDPTDRRFHYPYINCTNCGPRFSLMTALPYDRQTTTMVSWRMCHECDREFNDPSDRRFHAQPIACPACGPGYRLVRCRAQQQYDVDAIAEAARLLREGAIVAIKGVGGYHLACDARNVAVVELLRDRKYRKSRAFAVMVPDVSTAATLVDLTALAEAELLTRGRPIVLARARRELGGVAPAHPNLGVMLPYTPVHYLLFAAGAPDTLVMTSGNRSSEPIAFDDEEAQRRLAGIADAFLVGGRPIARRVDDSVVQAGALGATIVRRSRGYAPAVVARLRAADPILAVGADLKNTIALSVDGNVMVSQHIGDLEHRGARVAFEQAINDLLQLYDIDPAQLIVAHDRHPQYASTQFALSLPARLHVPVQHHRAHLASVLAERESLTTRVLGVAFDGTGFGDDGAIWGGEFFVGSVRVGFERVASLRPAALPGGDAAAVWPVQSAAGFVAQLKNVPELEQTFGLPRRYAQAQKLVNNSLRTFTTTSAGRLFDAVAALLGFTEQVTFEAQAALWLEYQATTAERAVVVPFEYADGHLDWRPALRAVIEARLDGQDVGAIARGFHAGLAKGISQGIGTLCAQHRVRTVVLTGGVFQNQLLLSNVKELLTGRHLTVWINHAVPAGDGGVSLGQAAITSLHAK
jgi:hydrogenase maturation protein HypF